MELNSNHEIKITSFIIFIIIFSLSSFSYGDVIEPGSKEVKIYYQISNIPNYPDYIFFINGIPNPSLEIINSSQFTFYKLSTVSIYAVSKRNYNEEQLKSLSPDSIEYLIKNGSNIIKSDLKLEGASKSVNINNNLEQMLITLNINSINGKSMNITKSKITYIFNEGSIQEETVKDQNLTPEPYKNSTSFLNFDLFYIVLPLIAVIALATILIKRLKK